MRFTDQPTVEVTVHRKKSAQFRVASPVVSPESRVPSREFGAASLELLALTPESLKAVSS